MAKTLNQLINEASKISRQLTSGDIPIVCRGCQDIELELKQHDVALWVELKLKRREISPEDFKSIIANQKPQMKIGNVVINDKEDSESKKW